MTAFRSVQPVRAIAVGMLACAFSVATQAASDLAGSQDPDSLERFPGTWIVAFASNAAVRSYEFVTGRVDRSHRNARIDHSVRLPAELVRVTYRTPDGSRFDEVIDHYRGLVRDLDADVVFTCRGRDCGRSTVWANDVFHVKELVAPDSAQFYLAAAWGRNLASIYVVQRGNRRVYAHVDLARAAAEVPLRGAGRSVSRSLSQHGFAVLEEITPDRAGVLDAGDLQALDDIAGELTGFAGRTIYVVCHLGGLAAVETSLARATACAEQASARLRAAGAEVVGFGGGPLLPRQGVPSHRLELVVFQRTRRAVPSR